MGEIKDKAKGAANEALGRMKQAAGKATRNPSLRERVSSRKRRAI